MKPSKAHITIAHLSDVHLAPLSGLWPRHWNFKRFFGLINWRTSRSKVHQRVILDALTRDLKTQNPEHTAITGDLINLGLPAELEAAYNWLEGMGTAHAVSAIPGNHDIYVPMHKDHGVARWQPYMSSNEAGTDLIARAYDNTEHITPPGPQTEPTTRPTKKLTTPNQAAHCETAFPYCRVLGPIALIGLNSAAPTPLFNATGYLGPKQRAKLAAILDEAARQALARVVLIHHPPLPGQAPKRRALRDADDLQTLLGHHGAELVLHGHNHRDTTTWCEGRHDPIPIIGVASGSAGRPKHGEPLASYNIIRLTHTPAKVRIDIITRGLKRPDGPFVDSALRSFEVRTTAQ